ncbi:hypothetical protein EI94DRAFT_1742248 [Lactarius quietus]|nr:hypothetical protein EI94DRAFT_1742248 [Lactarius quietus]
MPDAVDDNTAALEALHIYLIGAIEKIEHDISDLRNVVVAQQSGARVSARCVPPPPAFQEASAASAAAPSPMSLTSNVSSGSSMYIASLTLDSPQTRLAGLPVVGPSGIRQEHARLQAPGHILQSTSEQTRGTAMVKPPSRAPAFLCHVGPLVVVHKYITHTYGNVRYLLFTMYFFYDA